MGDLDNTTTKTKRERRQLTVVVEFGPVLSAAETEALEDDVIDLLLAMAEKRDRQGEQDESK